MFKKLLRLVSLVKKERLMFVRIAKCMQRQLDNLTWESVHNKFFNLTFLLQLLQEPQCQASATFKFHC